MSNYQPPYGTREILRYLKGEMSNSEMRDFELAALNDPFLQDAIDGYREVYQSSLIDEIPPMIGIVNNYGPTDLKKGKQPIIPIWRRKIVRYAAVAALITGTGWFLFNLKQPAAPLIVTTESIHPNDIAIQDSSPTQPFALNKLKELETVPPGTKEVPVIDRSKKSISNENHSDGEPQVSKAELSTAPGVKDLNADSARPQESFASRDEENPAVITQAAPSGNKSISSLRREKVELKPLSVVPAPITISGKVVDKEKYPLDNIKILVKGTRNQVVSDELGRFMLSIPESGGTLVASGPGYKTKEFKASSATQHLELELESAGHSLEDAVVMNYYSLQKKRITGRQELEMDTTMAVPVVGWKQFETFIRENKQLPKKGKSQVYVVLSFEINANGRPAEFDIIESGGAALDKEAIRLLNAGPGWRNKTNATSPMAKITIVF